MLLAFRASVAPLLEQIVEGYPLEPSKIALAMGGYPSGWAGAGIGVFEDFIRGVYS